MPDPDNPQIGVVNDGGPDNLGNNQVTGPINENGEFVENWVDKYPQEYRPTLSRFKKFDDLITSHMGLRKKFGHDPDSLIQIPREDSPDEVKAAFWKAAGRPETADEYQFQLSKELEEKLDVSNDKLEEFKKFAHKMNFSQSQFEKALDYYYTSVAKDIDDYDLIFQQQQDMDFKKAETELKKKWGNDYERRVSLANAVLKKYGGQDAVESMNAKNSPAMTEFLSNIAEAMSEDVIKGLTPPSQPTPSQIETKINELKMHPSYLDRKHPMHKEIVQQMTDLYKRKVKSA